MEQAHNTDLKLAESYFLGQLSDDEAEAFESHYFDCPRCAEYVAEELTMLESGRAVARTIPDAPSNVVPFTRRFRQWVPAAAAAMLVLAIGTPMLLDKPEPRIDFGAPTWVQLSADRAAAAKPLVFKTGAAIPLFVSIPPADFPRFFVTIRNDKNEIVDKGHEYAAEQTSEPVFLAPSALPAGAYNIVIEGVGGNGNRSPIARVPFEVREQ